MCQFFFFFNYVLNIDETALVIKHQSNLLVSYHLNSNISIIIQNISEKYGTLPKTQNTLRKHLIKIKPKDLIKVEIKA